jgi:MFS family permease
MIGRTVPLIGEKPMLLTETAASGVEVKRPSLARVIAASVAGTVLEWYEFFLYGLAASLVFGPLFFPTSNGLTAILLSFSTFSIGFIARPIGALIAGHFGDKVGRKNILTITLIMMGSASFFIGCIPTYHSIGVWAPITLCVTRFIQGLALGGEWAGAVLMISENARPKHRGFLASFIQCSAPMGNVLATGAFVILNFTMSNEAFLSYGWRIAFWMSAIVTLIGFYVRTRMAETPAFEKIKAERKVEAIPVVSLVKRNWRTVLACVAIRVGSDTAWTIFAVVSVVFVTTKLGLPRQIALNAVLIGAGVQVVMHALCGALADRVGRKLTSIAGSIGMAIWCWYFFPLLSIASPTMITVAVVGGLAFHSLVFGPMAAWFVELFPANVRFSGASLSHQVASLFGGAIAPLISFSLLSLNAGARLVAVYVIFTLVLSIIGAFALQETKGCNMS